MTKLMKLIGESREIFASVLCLLSCVLLAPSAQAATMENVKYIDATGQEQTCAAATVVADSYSRVTWSAGWYVVNGEVSINAGANCDGAVRLILADGASLTINNVDSDNAGIGVMGAGNSLAIYGQKFGTGELEITGCYDGAGIGGGDSGAGSNITINGGVVSASSEYGAGIGGGEYGESSNITINGGVVSASSDEGAGIGGGYSAAGSNITINGGEVIASSEDGAGIGGGDYGAGSNITINGGNVNATGGYDDAGIGGGFYGVGSCIRINGGAVTATGGENVEAIGSGYSGDAANNIFAADAVIVKAGTSANPTTEIMHTSTTDLAMINDFKKQYVTTELLPTEEIASSVTAPEHATAAIYTNKVVDAQYKTDGTVWSNRIAKVVYTVDSDKDWYFKGDLWVKAITNELDTTVNPAVDTNDLPAIVEVTCTRKFVTTEPDPSKPEEVQSPYVLEEDFTYTAAPAANVGGAFFVRNDATLTGANVTFADNKGNGGGAINISLGSTVALTNATFMGNKAKMLGGAICNDKGMLSLDGVRFVDNEAGYGGGAIFNATSGNVNFDGAVTLVTTNDTIVNCGTLNWNLADGKQGVLNGYDKLINADGTLRLTVEDYASETNFVIATGDFTDVSGKDTFTITNVTSGVTATLKIGGITYLNGTWWYLAIDEDELILSNPSLATLSDVFGIDEETGVTNATAVVTAGGFKVEPEKDGDYLIPFGLSVKLDYTAAEDYMFVGGAKTKSVNLGPLMEDTSMDYDCPELKPVAEAQWVDVREIAIDTRARIVVGSPNEVLPIAYSPNYWGEAAGQKVAEVQVLEPESEDYQTLIETNVNGYVEWKPTEEFYGKYDLKQVCKGAGGFPFMTNVTVYYSQPYALKAYQPEEGGTIKATASTMDDEADTVLAYDFVTLVATPTDATWQLKSWIVTTNDIAAQELLEEDLTSLTNRFEMPFCDTEVEAVFVVADSYVEAATNELTKTYEDDIAYLESILEEPKLSAAKADVKKAYDDGVTAILAATTPSAVDAAKTAAKKAVDDETRKHSYVAFAFEKTQYTVVEGETVEVTVLGGSMIAATQATVSYIKGTGAYKSATVDGKRVSFPLTLSWRKGDLEPKKIVFQTTARRGIDEDLFFALQLAASVGSEVAEGYDACSITIEDKSGGEDPEPYVQGLAYPANAGTVSGSGALATDRSVRTLTVRAKSYATFVGWFKAKADNPALVDLDAPVDPYNPRNPRQIRVGYGTENEAGIYYAYFTDVLPVAGVVEPKAFDASGAPLPGVTGVTAHDSVNGVYYTMVGVKFSLPVEIADESGAGRLKVLNLPYGLKLVTNRLTGEYEISGIPTRSGLRTVTFVASNAAGKHTVTYDFVVSELPAQAVGTFYGPISDDTPDGDHRCGIGSVTFTAGKTGALSAKVMRRLSGVRSFSVKGYDYIDENTLGVEMQSSRGEIFQAKLSLSDSEYSAQLVGTAFGGEGMRGTLGYYGETNGVFYAVRDAFGRDRSDAAKKILSAYVGSYANALRSDDGEDIVGTVQYRINGNGSLYVAANIVRSYDGDKPVSGCTLSGTINGGLVYLPEDGGLCGNAVLRNGSNLWSSQVLFDNGFGDVDGIARYIRPNAEDKSKVVDVDQQVGNGIN